MSIDPQARSDHDCVPPEVQVASPPRWRCDDCGAQWQLDADRRWQRLTDWEWDGG